MSLNYLRRGTAQQQSGLAPISSSCVPQSDKCKTISLRSHPGMKVRRFSGVVESGGADSQPNDFQSRFATALEGKYVVWGRPDAMNRGMLACSGRRTVVLSSR